MKVWWINSNSKKITARVSTTNNIITNNKTAPIFRKFVGQPLNNLQRWLGDGEVILIQDGD